MSEGSLLQSVQSWVIDRLAPQIDAFTWHRYSLIAPYLIHGEIRALNIGTGGGVETVRLLSRGNYVTTIEYNAEMAARTRARAVRAGYGDRHTGLHGHVLEVPLDETFHLVVMCEVLEHVMDDFAAIQRIARWLKPGGRLVLSTPTASYGQLPGDRISVVEDGGHVRVGYEGPELDAMLSRVGIITQKRILNSGLGPSIQHVIERRVRAGSSRLLGPALGLASRPIMGALDVLPVRMSDQITIATKLPT
jgi:SAM-dependent methyltransferase